ncbi:MAG: hypothetical protein ACFFCY_02725 [Promethearchaeota archaeon]
MGAGKIFCILGGIITLLATFLFSFGTFNIAPDVYVYGLAFIMNIGAFFTSGEPLLIVFAVVWIIFLLAGVFILIGIKSRALAIIGSVLAIVAGIYFVLSIYYVIPLEAGQFTFMFADYALVSNIIPLHVGLGGSIIGDVSIGTYLLIGGGVLGFIGGIMGPDGF